MLVVEMNNGQMLEDVLAITQGRIPVEFYGRMGGVVPYSDEVLGVIEAITRPDYAPVGHPRDRWLASMREMLGTGA